MRWRHGGYVAARKSVYGWWKHYLWSPDLETWYAYTPFHRRHFLLRLGSAPPLFRGYVEQDDASYRERTGS